MTGGRGTAVAALAAVSLGLAVPAVAGAASAGQLAADRGAELYRSGDLAAAREAFREAVRLDPGNSNAWQALGWVEFRLGHEDEALKIWTGLLRLEPGRSDTREALATLQRERARRAREGAPTPAPTPPAENPEAGATPAPAPATPGPDAPGRALAASLLEQGRRALAAGDLDEAERAFAELLAMPGLDDRWGARIADLFLRAGAVERGIAFLDRPGLPGPAARGRGLSQLHTARATALLRSGWIEEAVRALDRAIALDPQNRFALRGLGWAHRKARRLSEAEGAWTRYARTFPELAEPHDLLAGLFLDRREYEDALVEARASLAIDPAPKGAHLRYIRALFGLARIREARAAATALAARMPNDPQAQRILADALTKSRAFGEAARQWRRVLDLEPGSEVATQNWVRSLYEDGQADAAVTAAREIAASPQAPASVLELLADDGRATQDFAEAAVWYRELTRRFPDRVNHWRHLMQVLDLLGWFPEQVTVAREAVRRLPQRAELQLDLATALANTGALGEALALTRRYQRDFPDNRAAYVTLVDLLRRSGDFTGALRRIARSGPGIYQDHERRMLEASLRARLRDLPGAIRLLEGLVREGRRERFVPILLYHGIVAPPRTVQMAAAAFDSQMAALARAGFTPITLTELARMAAGDEPFPPRPILITFDDARTDSFLLGDAILARYGFRATMFVPTARIGVDDAFHAGWGTIDRFAGTGRWDMQAHGHEAHTPVPIDAAGDSGEFLAYRAYLADEERRETPDEFLARIDRDHRECRGELERHLRGHRVLGYAFPLNQVAYAQRDRDAALSGVNERAATRYFEFGLVQDDVGYNALRPGERAPFWLRRFEVPSGWTGEQLLAHLARRDPIRAAELELARLASDEGRPGAARRRVEEIVRAERLVAPEGEAALAQIAWEEERPREAAAHLAAGPPRPPGTERPPSSLETRLSWRNRPTAGAESLLFSDSDGRTTFYAGGRFARPLPDEFALDVGAGQARLAERGAPALAGPQLRGEVSGTVGHALGIEGWGRVRQLSGAPSSLNGGAAFRLRREQHTFSLRLGYEDVETAPAALEGIQRADLAAGYAFTSPRQRVAVSASQFAYDDGNRRIDFHALALRMVGGEAEWGLGASVDLEDSRFSPREYYAPLGLAVGMARASYRRSWSDTTSVAIGGGLGVARDDTHGIRRSALAELDFSRRWGARRAFGTVVGLEWRNLPGYRSLGAVARLEFRF